MIVLKQKNIEYIWEKIKNFNKIGIIGCGTCATVSLIGERQIEQLSLTLSLKDKNKKFYTDLIKRLCEVQFFKDLKDNIKEAEAIISLACGAGTQLLAAYLEIYVYPGVDTLFLGGSIYSFSNLNELCSLCGDCRLAEYGCVCPMTRCAKSLLNGPCGGARGELCEIKDEKCTWQLIYQRLKKIGDLSLIEKITPIFDYTKKLSPRSHKLFHYDIQS